MKSNFFRRTWVGGIVLLLCAIASKSQVGAQVSNAGLLIEYRYETSVGVGVTDGASATGQIDDTGLLPSIHAIGSGAGMIGLSYDADVPTGIGSSFSLNFPSPESAGNFVRIPMTDGDGLSSITDEDFRVETWFKTTDTGRSNLVSSYVGPRTSLNLELHTNNRGRIYVQGPTDTTDLNLTLPTDSRDGQWHHLAGVRFENTVELYYDFVLVGDIPDVAGSYTINKPEFFLGMDGRPSGTPRFQGSLDDVRIYNSADRSGLVVEYLFETIEGGSVFDGQSAGDQVDETAGVGFFHGEGSAATVLSTPRYVADVPAAISGHSTYSFAVDEQDTSVEDGRIPVTPELADITQGDFALESWFKTTDEGRGVLFGGFESGSDNVNLELHTDNRVRIYVDGPEVTDLNRDAIAGINTRDGQWHHMVGQREDDTVSVYLDGQLVDSIPDAAGAYSMQVADMFLGRDSRTGSTRFDGQLDNTRIWTRALSAAEIGDLAAGATVVPERSGSCDFNGDELCDVSDIDLMSGVGDLSIGVSVPPADPIFDLDMNDVIDNSDVDQWLATAAFENGFSEPYSSGDADVSGVVDASDLNALALNWQQNGATWSGGDFTGNGTVDAADLNKLALNWQSSIPLAAATHNVPEPQTAFLLVFAAVCIIRRHRHRIR